MNANTLLASLLLTTACGSVASDDSSAPVDDTADLDAGVDAAHDPQPDAPEVPEGPALPMLVEPAHAANSTTAISSVTYATGAALVELIRPTGTAARYDVLEQRMIPTSTGPLPVRIELQPPTGTYSRSVATFFEGPIDAWFPIQFLCSENGVPSNDPRCTMTAPAAALATASGEITNARWRMVVVDEATGVPVDACIDGGSYVDCVLPNPAGARYKVVVSADRFSQLWRSDLAFREISTQVGPMAGTQLPEQIQCKHMTGEAGSTRIYCDQYATFLGYAGLDTASLSLDPIQLTITAGGATQTFSSPAITWNPGNNDLPGDPY